MGEPNRDLVAQARDSLQRIEAAERDLTAANAALRQAVQELSEAGTSVAVIARALGLGQPRVERLLSTPQTPPIACSFCGGGQPAAGQLIAGPGVCICDGCVRAARSSEPGTAGWSVATQACVFCGSSPGPSCHVVARSGARICTGCLELCEEILADQAAG
jgi:ClpX C4-type zinc finger